jgi:hypothetical protein
MEEKKKRGRPKGSGIKHQYKKQYAKQLLDHMREGRSFESFAALIPCGCSTLYRFVEENPDFAEAKLVGHSLALYYWEEKGREHIVYHKDGPRLETAAWRIIMKNRFAWHDAQRIEHTTDKKDDKLIIDLSGIEKKEQEDEK